MKHLLIILCIVIGFLVVINIGLIIGIVMTLVKTCAGKRINGSTRIIGGKLQYITESPFFAGMIVKKGYYPNVDFRSQPKFSESDQYLCGSAIIGNYWVITAGHCTNDFVKETFPIDAGLIRSGTSGWNESRKTQKYTRDHQFKNIISHEKFDLQELTNDISLVQVVQPFTDGFAKNIPLAGKKYPYQDNSDCTVYGFGYTSYNLENENISSHLRSAEVKIVNHKKCKNAYDSLSIQEKVDNWNFCAGWSKDGRDACTYDSGGPLVQNGVLIGIVSFGQGCAEAKYPGVYTKVGAFQSWITKGIKNLKGSGTTFADSVREKVVKNYKNTLQTIMHEALEYESHTLVQDKDLENESHTLLEDEDLKNESHTSFIAFGTNRLLQVFTVIQIISSIHL